MNNSINTDTTVSNVNFTSIGWPRKVKLKKHTRHIKTENSTKTEKQKETDIRKSLEWIFKKLGFGKKLRNAGEEKAVNNNNNNKIIREINKARKNSKLRRNFSKNPDDARAEIMRESLIDIGRFFKDV